jgi:prepilin-type N-terminal cleavage/methylation domain-containing protein
MGHSRPGDPPLGEAPAGHCLLQSSYLAGVPGHAGDAATGRGAAAGAAGDGRRPVAAPPGGCAKVPLEIGAIAEVRKLRQIRSRITIHARSSGTPLVGFTLIELLIGIAIIGVVASVGIIYMPRGSMAAREAARVLAADLNRARTEGIKHNTNVAFDFDNAACTGYCIYTDFSRSASPDGNLDGDPAGTIELAQPKLLDRSLASEFPRMEVVSFDFGSSPRVWFDVRGLPRASTGAYFGSTGRIVLRPSDGGSGYVVTLEPQGRVQVSRE